MRAQRRVSQGVLVAAASCAVGFPRLRFAVLVAVHPLQCPGFRITIFDTRTRGDGLKPRSERVVVEEE